MQMAYRQWVRRFIAMVLGVITLFALFNYTIDPLWTFCHSNRFNNAQPGFNERQLKTNRAYFCGLEQYDALLLGSSRVTYINQHDFEGMNVFNYAAVSTYPVEYKGWLDVAKKIKQGAFKTVIIGVDFFGSGDGAFCKHQMKTTPPASHYFGTTTSFLYRYKMLFSMDTLNRSLESIEHSRHLGTIDYTRDNVKQTIHIDQKRAQRVRQQQRQIYINAFYGKAYHYDRKLKSYFKTLIEENPQTRFVIFTTPISAELFSLLVKEGNLPDYKRWMHMLVDTFGEVYDFMGVNTITKDLNNYADLHHFYPNIGTLIADRITGVKNPDLPEDFGVLITDKNIDAHLQQIEAQAKRLQNR